MEDINEALIELALGPVRVPVTPLLLNNIPTTKVT